MKRKLFLTLATALVSTTLLASCSACDGCSGNTKVYFKPYFLNDVDTASPVATEKMTYTVTHSGNNSYNNYSVHYSNGSYTTTLTTNDDGTYIYESKLSINVVYEFGGESTDVLTDSVVSTITFQNAKNMLQPISSTSTRVSHSPSQSSATKLDEAFFYYNQTITTDYEGKKGVTTVVDNTIENASYKRSFDFETDKYTYVDNEQLLFVLRCMDSNSEAKLQSYDPFNKTMQTVSASFGSAASMTSNNLVINGTPATQEIAYYPISLKLDAKKAGATQTVWIAKTTNPKNNAYRNVMLKYVNPLPFTLGELTYELVDANFQ